MDYFFICPYCGENISMILDLSEKEQTYAEDCEVCCNPIEIDFKTDGSLVTFFEASKSE